MRIAFHPSHIALVTLLFGGAFAFACKSAPPPAIENRPLKADAGASPAGPTTKAPPEKVQYDDAALDLFKEQKVTGSFVLFEESSGTTTIVGKEDAYVRWQPCSTFKIPNTLIGLETGVIPDARFSLKWDGKKRSVEDWNRDHDLASAMRFSVVWFYQEVARRIGEAKMKSWVTKLDYGNHTVSGPIDAFWLDDGSLRISAPEQATFLRRFKHDELPVRGENSVIVRRIIPMEQFGPTTVYGKTGRCTDKDQAVGWYVGWVDQQASTRFIYALHVRAPASDLERLVNVRRDLLIALLKHFRAL